MTSLDATFKKLSLETGFLPPQPGDSRNSMVDKYLEMLAAAYEQIDMKMNSQFDRVDQSMEHTVAQLRQSIEHAVVQLRQSIDHAATQISQGVKESEQSWARRFSNVHEEMIKLDQAFSSLNEAMNEVRREAERTYEKVSHMHRDIQITNQSRVRSAHNSKVYRAYEPILQIESLENKTNLPIPPVLLNKFTVKKFWKLKTRKQVAELLSLCRYYSIVIVNHRKDRLEDFEESESESESDDLKLDQELYIIESNIDTFHRLVGLKLGLDYENISSHIQRLEEESENSSLKRRYDSLASPEPPSQRRSSGDIIEVVATPFVPPTPQQDYRHGGIFSESPTQSDER